MTDKMREAFEKWYMTNTFAHVDHLSVFYNDLNCYSTPIANHCWKAWQAAQAEQPVPVVGEADCYDAGLLSDFGGGNVEWWQDYIRAELARAHEFYVSQMPTHSITTAELERLRKDAERYRWLRDRMVGAHFDFDDEGMVILAFEMPDTARISADCDETIDSAAAIAAEGEKE